LRATCSTTAVHPSALVDPSAELGEDVEIGPYCIVGPAVRLGDRVQLKSHVVIEGATEIGADTVICAFANLGGPPQHLAHKGEATRLIVGEHNTIREHVTMHTGTVMGGGVTRVGSHSLFMVASHVAHDCIVGDHVVFANNATLGGHVTVGDFAILGGLSAVHQFCRIGHHAMIGGMTGVEHDLIPYGMAVGDRARLVGLNLRGLQRRGFGSDDIQGLRRAYKVLFGDTGTFAERLEQVAGEFAEVPPAMEVVDFIRAQSSRRIVQPESGHGG